MKEADFAYRVRQALNEGLVHLDYKTTLRLEQARKTALARHRPRRTQTAPLLSQAWATAGGPSVEQPTGAWLWLQRLGLVAPLFALLAGFIGIYQWQSQQLIEELASIDLAVLLDEGPIDAYADRGFGVLLTNPDTQ